MMMIKSKREQELEIENRRLKKKIEDLETEKKTFKMQLRIQNEQLEDLAKDSKIKEYQEYKRKYELLLQERQEEKARQQKEVEALEVAVKNLTDRINKDSSNSSKPSSSDTIYKKKKRVNTSRVKTGRKTGGQLGHKGTGLTKETAEELIASGKVEHVVVEHVDLGADVNKGEYIVKYEIDIEIKTKVIEHRFYEKEGVIEVPEEYNTDVTYGNNLKTFATVAINEGFISLNRTSKIINEMTDNTVKLSEGTLVNFNKELANKAAGSIERIKAALIKAGVLHVDETGVKINGELKWLHTAVTKHYTYYQIENKRGQEGISNLGILEYYVGMLVHDHFVSYYKYKTMTHAECNAHILRYLKQVIELFKRKGAEKFLEYLIQLNNEKKALEEKDIHEFPSKKIEEIENEYLNLINEWEREYLAYVKGKKKTQSLIDEGNLFKRLKEYKEEHLQFVKKFEVPFSNNCAEKSLRLIKTKIKVSGCFRGKDNGGNFTTIRSLFETAKKQGLNLFESVIKTFNKEALEFTEA